MGAMIKLYKVFAIKYGKSTGTATFRYDKNGQYGQQGPLFKNELPKTVYVVTDDPSVIEQVLEEQTGWTVEKFKVDDIQDPVYVSIAAGS